MCERISVVIPALNEEHNLRRVLPALVRALPESVDVEVVVVDGGSADGTRALARAYGTRVLDHPAGAPSDPAALRNRGAAAARGDLLVFLDADSEPAPDWLKALLRAHADGHPVVGGAFALPRGLSPWARCDFYAGWYHFHPAVAAGSTISAPPGNLCIEAALFRRTGGFDEAPDVAYSHEELRLQGELRRAGVPLHFEPSAVVYHHNRPRFRNLLARQYRWGVGAVAAKAGSGAARFEWLYRHPWLAMLAGVPLAFPTAAYIVWRWARAGVLEPVAWAPAILASRVAYGIGLAVGGARFLARRRVSSAGGAA